MTGNERPTIDKFFKDLLRDRLFANLLVLDEALHISRSRYRVPRVVTMNSLRQALLPYTEIIPIGEEDLKATERYLIEYDIKPSDAIHLATMDKAGITSIISEDKELDKVKGINRIWLEKIHKPLRS